MTGTLVSTQTGNPRRVELAATDTAKRLVGVVDKNPLLTISDGSREVAVVLTGSTQVLVSDIIGAPQTGDKITASPVTGVGMRASEDSQVVGTAQAGFTAAGAQTRTITDSDGKAHTVHIGYIPLQIGIAYYQAPGSNFLPPFIQDAANSLAGRAVSLFRMLLCAVLLLIGAVTATVLVYSSMRSAMTSIGRNPLAAGAIRKSLYQMLLIAFGILAGALLAGYVVLKV